MPRPARFATLRPRLLGHILRSRLLWILGWSATLVVLIAGYSAAWPVIRRSVGLGRPDAQIVDKLPDASRGLVGTTTAGYFNAGYFHAELITSTAALVLLVCAIAAGTHCVAGLEQTGRLEILLAHPVSRTRWVLEQASAMLLGLVTISAITTVALLAAVTLTNAGLGTGHVLATGAHLAALACWFGMLALAVGAGTGRPGPTWLACAVIALIAYLSNDIGALTAHLTGLRSLSVFRWTLGDDPLSTGLHPTALTVVLSSAVLLLLAGTAVFHHRDLRC